MGVDISAYIEVFDGNEWKAAVPPEPFIYNDYEPHFDKLGYHFDPPETIFEPEYFQIERNSAFYNALGGQWSKYELEELAARRGLPKDIDPVTRDYILRFQKINSDYAYGYSWVILEEIINAGWNKKLTSQHGFIKNEHLHLFSNGNQLFPSDLSESDLKWFESPGYSEVIWKVTYEEAIGKEYLNDILNRLSAYGEPNKVRMIYWYY